MTDETTPLVRTVVVRRRAPAHNVCSRFVYIAFMSICIFILLTFFVGVFVDVPNRYHWPPHRGGHGHRVLFGGNPPGIDHDLLRRILDETPDAALAEEWSRYYTAGPHLAGQNRSQAEWTKEKWEEWGVKSDIVSYDVYLNYPREHSLRLLSKKNSSSSSSSSSAKGDWKVEFVAALEEDVLDGDGTSGLKDRVPTFHGYAASGNVTGSFVFVNYGTYQDYEDLRKANISLEGRIAIARYGGIFRGLKVKRAQELGAVGVLLYSDPGDDGEYTEENGYEQYPKGPARHPTSVQRGSVEFLSTLPGDPTTPGYPSKPGVPRAPVDDTTPSIPSIPISYADAVPILKALNGHGPLAKDLNKYWDRNLGLRYKGVDYNIGPTPDGVVLNLYNDVEYRTTPLWNVIGVVNGSSAADVVVVGNHRDAWIAGGAGDPNSGSAVINEVVRGVGKAVEAGWKPFRTIVFASWDGEEYSLIGSTEWVEEYLPWLKAASFAYVNVDVGVNGPNFKASAAPLLHGVVRAATRQVLSANQTVERQTVADLWDGHISPMGSGSDFTAFQDHAGIPSIDMGFGFGKNSAVYHYHSNYDSFDWMAGYGDPGFKYHRTMAQVLGVVVAELSNRIIVPFNATDYADALDGYVQQIEARLSASLDPHFAARAEEAAPRTDDEVVFEARARQQHGHDEARGSPDAFRRELGALRAAVKRLRSRAARLDGQAAWANEVLARGVPWWKFWEAWRFGRTVVRVNKAYKYLEREFLYEGGLDGRSWFKHVVFAPGLWTGYAGAVFPGLVESVDAKDYVNAIKWVTIINNCVTGAIKSIA